MKIKILIDSSSGIERAEANKLDFEMISLPFFLDEKEYDDSISKKEFYEKLKTSNKIHTSQASIEAVQNKFDEILKDNDAIIYFPITSGLSSSYGTAMFLCEEEKYKNKVFCVDHRTISVVERYMLKDVKKLIDNNVDILKIKQLIENNSNNNSIYIAVDSLDYLKKGGRVKTLTAAVGNLLQIKPILYSDGGNFEVIKKVRSMKLAKENMIELIKTDIKEKFKCSDIKNVNIGVAYSENYEEAMELKNMVEDEFNAEVILDELPSVIGCHVGPGVLGLAIYRKLEI